MNNSKISLTTETLNRLERILANLTEKKEWLGKNIKMQNDKLQTLWNCLEIDKTTRNNFPTEFPCCQVRAFYSKEKKLIFFAVFQSSLDTLETEIKRCEEIKKQNIRKCVEKYRNEIEIYWNKTLKSKTECENFIYFTSDCFTEDLLSLHEIELNELKEFYEANL